MMKRICKQEKNEVLRQYKRFSRGRQFLNYKEVKEYSRGGEQHKQPPRGKDAVAKFAEQQDRLACRGKHMVDNGVNTVLGR